MKNPVMCDICMVPYQADSDLIAATRPHPEYPRRNVSVCVACARMLLEAMKTVRKRDALEKEDA